MPLFEPSTPQQPSVSSITAVTSSTTSVALMPSNPNRLGGSIFNDSTKILFVKLGSVATLTDYSVKILAGGFYELPDPIYTGQVDGVWNAVQGFARVTELNP